MRFLYFSMSWHKLLLSGHECLEMFTLTKENNPQYDFTKV